MNNPHDEQRLRQTLQAVAQRDVPPTLDLRRAVWAQLRAQPAAPPLWPALPWGRTLLATGLLLALVAVALSGLLGVHLPVVGNLAGGPAGPAPVSQTIKGYTLTLYPGQVDANWVVLTYTLRSPVGAPVGIVPGRWSNDTYLGPHLTTEQGQDLDIIGTFFPPLYNTDTVLWTSPITEAEMVFRTDALGAAPTRHLHLDLSLAQLVPPAPSAPPQPWWLLSTTPAAGPFAFDLDVPVNRVARIASIGQTVRAGNVSLQLERVMVTATETRLFLRPENLTSYPTTSWGNNNLAANMVLQVGDWSSAQAGDIGVGRVTWDGQDWVIAYIDHSLLDQPGDWTLTVADLPNPATPGGGTLRGPWAFHFTVRPAGPQP